MQASALADLTAAVSEMCYCGAGMNHFEPISVVRGITELYRPEEILARCGLGSSVQAARQVCVL